MEFFKHVHEQFYADIDTSFMEYFLEIAEHEDEFIVHHSKLHEYGVVTSTQSYHMKEKFDTLELVEQQDYQLTDIREPVKQGGFVNHKHYHLTPEAFKKCLMRARKYANQPVDPVIYVDYYLLLEKIFGLFRKYQVMYSEKLISMKDDKIDMLTDKVDELLGYAKDTKNTLDNVQDELTETKETVEIARTYLVEKSLKSTINPISESQHHNFAATTFVNKDHLRVVKFTTGTKSYVERTIAKYVTDSYHTIAIQPFYNANGFDLRQNCYSEFIKLRKQRVLMINRKNASNIRSFNLKLAKEIREYNKLNPDNKRVYAEEKRNLTKIYIRDISVKFLKTQFTYTDNPHMSFEEVLNIVIEVNRITQDSPLTE